MKKVGTLKELDVKPGDVVECVTDTVALGSLTIGENYNIGGSGCPIDNKGEQFPWTWATFCIISRATNAPKLWRDRTDAEKGALLLALHERKVIEYLRYDGAWVKSDLFSRDYGTYRVRPEPKVETVKTHGTWSPKGQMPKSSYVYEIEFETINGHPQWNTAKVTGK